MPKKIKIITSVSCDSAATTALILRKFIYFNYGFNNDSMEHLKNYESAIKNWELNAYFESDLEQFFLNNNFDNYKKIIFIGFPLINLSPKIIQKINDIIETKTTIIWIGKVSNSQNIINNQRYKSYLKIFPQKTNYLSTDVCKIHPEQLFECNQPKDDFPNIEETEYIRSLIIDEYAIENNTLPFKITYDFIINKTASYRHYVNLAIEYFDEDPNYYLTMIHLIVKNSLLISDPINSSFTSPTLMEKELLTQLQEKSPRYVIIGNSPAINKIKHDIHLFAKENEHILILGESGTGKENIAQCIHKYDINHNNQPMVCFNCSSINPQLQESILFGYEQGAFTGANKRTNGLFHKANNGILFFDEIGELSEATQGALLRFFTNHKIRRIGGEEEKVNVRIIAATNRNLWGMAKDGKFHEDLLYRLNTLTIKVPPLRERIEDLDALIYHYFKMINKTDFISNKNYKENLKILKTYNYPGNIRELFTILRRINVYNNNHVMEILQNYLDERSGSFPKTNILPELDTQSEEPAFPIPLNNNQSSLIAFCQQYCTKVYNENNKNASLTAKILGISRSTLNKYLKEPF